MGVYDVEADIIFAIKDGKSLELFNIIGGSKRDFSELDLSHKGYYRRLSRLIATGLVKRESGRYELTALGIIVYRGQLAIQKAVTNYWNLKALDVIVSSGKIGEEERVTLIKTIVDDQEIQRAVLKTYKSV
jgi:predicted transcriptional regulator